MRLLALVARRVLAWDAEQKHAWLVRVGAGLGVRVDGRLVDIGSGSGQLTVLLRAGGAEVIPVDVVDWALTRGATPLLCAGERLPFAANSFDLALLASVLHHVEDSAALLREAKRVAPVVVVVEDVYRNRPQRWLTLLADSVANASFMGHPHGNRTVGAWLALFASLGLAAAAVEERPFLGLFRQALFVLRRDLDSLPVGN
jgi:SAM-dependent methyltransferase